MRIAKRYKLFHRTGKQHGFSLGKLITVSWPCKKVVQNLAQLDQRSQYFERIAMCLDDYRVRKNRKQLFQAIDMIRRLQDPAFFRAPKLQVLQEAFLPGINGSQIA